MRLFVVIGVLKVQEWLQSPIFMMTAGTSDKKLIKPIFVATQDSHEYPLIMTGQAYKKFRVRLPVYKEDIVPSF